jgi:hypothetical protein
MFNKVQMMKDKIKESLRTLDVVDARTSGIGNILPQLPMYKDLWSISSGLTLSLPKSTIVDLSIYGLICQHRLQSI